MSNYNYPSAILEIDLDAVANNWKLLRSVHASNNCAAVVKANAYGLGVVPVSTKLYDTGCRIFFVATIPEAIELREAIVDDASIYIFHGIFSDSDVKICEEYNLFPVLNDLEQIKLWQNSLSSTQYKQNKKIKAALHIDTGMCRLGLNIEDFYAIDDMKSLIEQCNINLVMSHLACAATPEHKLNQQQKTEFIKIRQHIENNGVTNLTYSLANSSGHFLDKDFHYDLGRPGCAIYGVMPNVEIDNPMKQVATLKAPILQIRDIKHNQTVGYGATCSVQKGDKVAVVACGYEDGIQRIASNLMSGWIGDYQVKMLGRVSMDMICYDISAVPEQLLAKENHITIIGKHQTVDKVAEICHTIGYEILTNIGNRVERRYLSV